VAATAGARQEVAQSVAAVTAVARAVAAMVKKAVLAAG